jgi:hypothetical protein
MQFERAVQVLCDAGVEFVVIGGVAGVFHGSVRVTYDLDICYSRSQENLGRLAVALSPFHPRPRGFSPTLPFVWDERTLLNATVFTLQTDLGEVDLLAEVAGLGSFKDLQAHSIMVEAFGRRIWTLDLPALIRAKRAAAREKDLSAIPELESLLEAGQKD